MVHVVVLGYFEVFIDGYFDGVELFQQVGTNGCCFRYWQMIVLQFELFLQCVEDQGVGGKLVDLILQFE